MSVSARSLTRNDGKILQVASEVWKTRSKPGLHSVAELTKCAIREGLASP